MVRLDHCVQGWLKKSAAPNTSLKFAQKQIKAGEFRVGGIVTCEPKQQLVPGVADEAVTLAASGESLSLGHHAFYLLHKPVGCVCQRHPRQPTIYDLIPEEARREDLVSVGRLDRDTTGALLLGTDGGLQSMLLFPTSRVWKTYIATLDPSTCPLRSDAVAAFRDGLVLDDDGTHCAPATLALDAAFPFRATVTLHEGFFHQVKRMLHQVTDKLSLGDLLVARPHAPRSSRPLTSRRPLLFYSLLQVGGTVVALHRSRFGLLDADGIPPGTMRPLTTEELSSLREMLPADRVKQRDPEMEQARGKFARGMPPMPRLDPGADAAGPEGGEQAAGVSERGAAAASPSAPAKRSREDSSSIHRSHLHVHVDVHDEDDG